MEESMKKLILLAVIAMMLLSMLAMSACKPKPVEEPMTEEVIIDEVPAVDTLNVDVEVTPGTTVTP